VAEAFRWPEAVVVLSNDPDTVAGLLPRFQPQWTRPNLVVWFEGGRERCFEVERVVLEEPELFRFRSRGTVYTLQPMTIARYNAHVRERTVGKPAFQSLDALLTAMRREW
jgi:hypothetical protein